VAEIRPPVSMASQTTSAVDSKSEIGMLSSSTSDVSISTPPDESVLSSTAGVDGSASLIVAAIFAMKGI
jgi:hypothetical protein